MSYTERQQRERDCPFCAIIYRNAPAKFVRMWPDAIAIEPLDPVVEGHVLVIPRGHVEGALEDPVVTAAVMARAAEIARRPCNIITSAGAEATQTVFHLHVHIVPRRANDGIGLPWTKPSETRVAFQEFMHNEAMDLGLAAWLQPGRWIDDSAIRIMRDLALDRDGARERVDSAREVRRRIRDERTN